MAAMESAFFLLGGISILSLGFGVIKKKISGSCDGAAIGAIFSTSTSILLMFIFAFTVNEFDIKSFLQQIPWLLGYVLFLIAILAAMSLHWFVWFLVADVIERFLNRI